MSFSHTFISFTEGQGDRDQLEPKSGCNVIDKSSILVKYNEIIISLEKNQGKKKKKIELLSLSLSPMTLPLVVFVFNVS